MCDTAVVVGPDRVLFAKNSDRDPNEAQLLDWQPRAEHAADARLRCTWIEIPQARETHAVLLSRPFWMWGAEIGANEHGVVIGNEAVFTRHAVPEVGLTGMDLLRLALERAASAAEAVDVIVSLAAEHGQGGGCGHEDRGFRYHSSYLIADPGGAYVLETAGAEHATERVAEGARTISNGLTIAGFASRHGDRLKTRGASAARRRSRTTELASVARDGADMMALLADHGGREPRYARLNGAMGSPCVHAGGGVVNSQTTASWVSELGADGVRHWATGTAAPCTGLFKPIAVSEPLDLGPEPSDTADPDTLWWAHERIHRSVLGDPARLRALLEPERSRLQRRFLEPGADPAAAFAAEAEARAIWLGRLAAEAVRDRRPGRVGRYWEERNRAAAFGPGLPAAP